MEGFFLGLVIERAAQLNRVQASSLLCTEHLCMLRDLADKIPLDIVGPSHRHLLHLGLSVVGDGGKKD